MRVPLECVMPSRLISLAAACLLLTGTAHACNIPVFRYALERWKPDPFDITVYELNIPALNSVPTDPELPHIQSLRGLRDFSLQGYGYGNYYFNAIELHALAAARLQAFTPGLQVGLLDPQLDAISTLAANLVLAE